MAAFEYSALNAAGKTRKGVLEGDTARQIRSKLRDQGLTPLSVEAVVNKRSSRSMLRGGRVRTGDLAMTTRQLSTLISSGLVLEEALRAVAQQSEKGRLKSILLSARSRVMEGHTLATGLADFPDVFSDLYRATIAAGEQSGRLDLVLDRLADYTESRQALSQKITLALFYPIILSVIAIIVVVLLLAYVVPQVVQVFDNIGQELPWLTRAMIAMSDFLVHYGVFLFAAIVVAMLAVRYVLSFSVPRRWYHRFLLKLPMISRLVIGLNTVRFTRTLGTLLVSSVPILDALEISGQVVTSIPMRDAIGEATVRIREGAGIAESLSRSGLFPPVMIHLIASGESSGKLEAMLDKAAVNQERQMETFIGMFLGMFEPLLIVAMGGIVVTIVIAILLPIFELNTLIK